MRMAWRRTWRFKTDAAGEQRTASGGVQICLGEAREERMVARSSPEGDSNEQQERMVG